MIRANGASADEIVGHHDPDPSINPWVHGRPPEEDLVVAPYDAAWPALYAALARRIADVLGGVALGIEHVGSTAVPGLEARPVIDIDLTVEDPADEDAYAPRLAALGYDLTVREPAWHAHQADEVAAWVEDHGSGQEGRDRPDGQDGADAGSMPSIQSIQSIRPLDSGAPQRASHAGAAANAALVLIGVAVASLDRQINAQAAAFEREGGSTERLYRTRQRERRGGMNETIVEQAAPPPFSLLSTPRRPAPSRCGTPAGAPRRSAGGG